MLTGKRAFTVPLVDTFDLDSAVLNRRFEISVALPFSYRARPEHQYPVLVVTDATLLFATTVEATRLMSLGQEVEDLILVGVGCPWSEGPLAFGRRRFYEFSPSANSTITGPFAAITRDLMAKAGVDREPMGGAPKYLQMLVQEVLPAVTREYRADLAAPGLIGESAGGTFALYALFTETSPFRRYLIGSPATAQCDNEVFKLEERYAAGHQDLDAKVFLAAGTQEMMSPFLEGGGIASGVCRMSGLLAMRRYPSLSLTSHMFNDESHLSVAPGFIARGLRVVYGTGRMYGEMPKQAPPVPHALPLAESRR
jgi:hypothetical protein